MLLYEEDTDKSHSTDFYNIFRELNWEQNINWDENDKVQAKL